MRSFRLFPLAAVALVVAAQLSSSAVLAAQTPEPDPTTVTRLEAEPTELSLRVGDVVPLTVTAYDAAGAVVDIPIRVSAPRRAMRIRDGNLEAFEAGQYDVRAMVVMPASGAPVAQLTIPVVIDWPEVTVVEVDAGGDMLYAGSTVRFGAVARHADGSPRTGAEVAWSVSDTEVATVDAFGNVTAHRPGPVTVTAMVEGVRGSVEQAVEAFPATTLELTGGGGDLLTGDVVQFNAAVLDEAGNEVPGAPVTWSLAYMPDDSIVAPAGPGQVDDGRFVADWPGLYTVVATTGNLSARESVRVSRRGAVQELEIVGQGRESRVFTTDLWIWEGRRTRLCAHGLGNGVSFVWDITDPANIVKTDSIQVDARTTNDVKASPDGRYGVISREGASNRRNGVVILDLANPAHPTIASTWDEGVTGGVHNMFATNEHLFVLSAGDKYVILDMADIYNPRYVGEYDHPDSRVHDVWVHDGIAYSAEWENGIVVVDVGNGRWGGSPENPVFVTNIPLPSGQTHAIFPYLQESTGKFYLIAGDEIVGREGLAWAGTGPDHRIQYDPETGRGGYPRATTGYIQIVDFTDPESPEMVARYEVSEYGTHNMWVEDDILYEAYYEGGLRMVDISGDLAGNLYTQGREIAVFKAHDPLGYIPNAPAAWGVMPWKGNVFFADINSGLWSVKILPKERPVS